VNVTTMATNMGNTTIARTGSSTTCGAGQWLVNVTSSTTGMAGICTAIPTYNNGSVTGVTAADTSITIAGTAAAPTVAVNITTIATNMGNSTIARTNAANTFTSSNNMTALNITGSGYVGGNSTCMKVYFNSTVWFGIGSAC
jgi:hypothetical protein